MAKAEIWYAIPMHGLLIIDERGAPQIDEGQVYDRIATIPVNDIHGTQEKLEHIFRAFNCVDGSEIEAVDSYKCRSMSIGDIVGIDGIYWLCQPAGWGKIGTGWNPIQGWDNATF